MKASVCAIVALAIVATCFAAEEQQSDDEAAGWFVSKAKKLIEAGKHEEAVNELSSAIKLVPNHHEAYLLRGDAHTKLGNKPQALSDYNIASKIPEGEEEENEEEDEDGAATKKSLGEHHQGADSLNIGWDKDEDEESDEAVEAASNTEEVQPVANPHPELWDDKHSSQLNNNVIEKWFTDMKSKSNLFKKDVEPAEKKALEDLYGSTQGEGWIMNGNWNEGDPCNNRWWGVTCKAGVGDVPTVVELVLNGNGMNGTMPASIAGLKGLAVINLKHNSLNGDIPDEFSQLLNLEQMRLGENKMSFRLALAKGMSKLQVLDLAENHPKGDLNDLTSLENLRSIRLQGAWDGLIGEIPPSLGRMKSLVSLNLAGAKLTGSIPDTFDKLEELKLNGNELSGAIPANLLASKVLKRLDLSRNFLTGELDLPEGGMPSIQVLSLAFNNLRTNAHTMDRLFSSPHLAALDMASNTHFGGALPPRIGDAKFLSVLRLSSCNLSGAIPAEIGNLHALHEVILHHNQLTGGIPAALAQSQTIATLRLDQNKLSGQLPSPWKTPKLVRLNLHSNGFAGGVPSDLYASENLTELYLDGNGFTDFGSVPKDKFAHCALENNPGYDASTAPPECGKNQLAKGGKRTFRICDTRVEIYVDVLKGHYGWEETNGNDWDTAFGECYGGSHEYRHLRTNQKIMEFPELDMIWDKGKYAANMERFRRTSYKGEKLDKFMDVIPRSFILPAEAQAFDATFAANPGSWWLLKPRASCCGRGIKLINETHEIPRMQMGAGDGYIIQRFLHNPWLVAPGESNRNTWVSSGRPVDGVAGPTGMTAGNGVGYKFVIRQFVVATSFEPVQMYTYPDGLLFWTRGPHSTDSKDWKDRANFITDYFFTHVQTKLQLTTSELRNLMAKQGVNEALIWAKIKESVTKAYLPVAARIAQQEGKFIPRRGGAFHVWGYDIMVDANGNAVVCEINAHPNTDLEIVKEEKEPERTNLIKGDRELKMDLTDHMTRVIGMMSDAPMDKEKYAAVVDKKLPNLKWQKPTSCDGAAGFRCLKDYEYMDLITAEFEDANKGPLERNFPSATAKHLAPMLMDDLPRSRLLLEYWSGPDGDGHIYNADGTFKDKRGPYIAPKIKKRFARDEL